jgi:hypothetical protein
MVFACTFQCKCLSTGTMQDTNFYFVNPTSFSRGILVYCNLNDRFTVCSIMVALARGVRASTRPETSLLIIVG